MALREGGPQLFDRQVARGEEGWMAAEVYCQRCGVRPLPLSRHHCRRCGHLYCDRCTVEYLGLPVCRVCETRFRYYVEGTALWDMLGQDAPLYYAALAGGGQGEEAAGREADELSGQPEDALREQMEAAGMPADVQQGLLQKLSARRLCFSSSYIPAASAAAGPGSRLSVGGRAVGRPRGDGVAPPTGTKKELRDTLQKLIESVRSLRASHAEKAAQLKKAQDGRSLEWLQDRHRTLLADESRTADEKRKDAARRGAGRTFAWWREQREKDFKPGSRRLQQCEMCSAKYSFTDREHHCRTCFASVCSRCSMTRDAADGRRCDRCCAMQVLSQSKAGSAGPVERTQSARSGVWVARLAGSSDSPSDRTMLVAKLRKRARELWAMQGGAAAEHDEDMSRQEQSVMDRFATRMHTYGLRRMSSDDFRQNSFSDDGEAAQSRAKALLDSVIQQVFNPSDDRDR